MWSIQVYLFQKLLFLHQLTHNMTTDCAWNYHENKCRTWAEHVLPMFCACSFHGNLSFVKDKHVNAKKMARYALKMAIYQLLFFGILPNLHGVLRTDFVAYFSCHSLSLSHSAFAMFTFQFCPKLQDKHCKSTMTQTKTKTMTGKISYMPPPLGYI